MRVSPKTQNYPQNKINHYVHGTEEKYITKKNHYQLINDPPSQFVYLFLFFFSHDNVELTIRGVNLRGVYETTPIDGM